MVLKHLNDYCKWVGGMVVGMKAVRVGVGG